MATKVIAVYRRHNKPNPFLGGYPGLEVVQIHGMRSEDITDQELYEFAIEATPPHCMFEKVTDEFNKKIF